MADNKLSFKSFYFSLGTTSFRMQNFNQKIEQQLDLLDQFWQQPEYKNQNWNETVQAAYYDFIKEKGFLKDGDAPRKAKDARQKTSGLRDIGLIDTNRKLTMVGRELLKITRSGDFTSDNFLQIPNDSFIYFQQLLKASVEINKGNFVRPFIVLLRLLHTFGNLREDEFKYLFPLCIDEKTTSFVEQCIDQIRDFRKSSPTIDGVIVRVFMQQNNYQKALDYFINEETVTEDTFCVVGMNRKSKEYDRHYFPLYNALKKIYKENDHSDENIESLLDSIKALPNVGSHWYRKLFGFRKPNQVKEDYKKGIHPRIYHVSSIHEEVTNRDKDEEAFRKWFFNTLHLIKTKRTLEDYFDLNRRYLNISDTILFADKTVQLDIIPKCYFSRIPCDFYNLAFKKSDNLYDFQRLDQISPYLKLNEKELLNLINTKYKTSINKISDIKLFVENERLQRFNKLIDKKFSVTRLIEILQLITQRKDKEIKELVTDNADIPTIFEYIIGISWYEISERKGNILSFMNLSLDANLLPKTHAGGGEADLIFQYSAENGYPEHSLLIEATLSESSNQRRMEMEPVSRHLGEYLISHKDHKSYCVFLTNFLHMNVISDFRSRQTTPYYGGKNYEDMISGMNIIPLENELLITFLKNNIKYSKLYSLFNQSFGSSLAPKEWYEELKKQINSNNFG